MNKELIKSFIDKWNVGFEDKEQKAELAADMEADLMAILQSTPFTHPLPPKAEAERLYHELGKDEKKNISDIYDILKENNR